MRAVLQLEADSVLCAHYVGMLVGSESVGAERGTAEVQSDPYCQYEWSRHIIS